MRKNIFLVLTCIILFGVYYIFKQINNQNEKNNEKICDCRKKQIFIKRDIAFFTLDSNNINLLFHNEKINYEKKHPYGKGFVISIEMPVHKSSTDTLYFKDNKKTFKMYDFVVDTLIVNRQQGIICDLKEVTIDGKKQYARGLIILD